jgi:ring-1,2-phenylacetyl-CoA epoxidase subunit PaaB
MDTQWPVFEVFHQQARGEPHVHVGSVHAPDAEMALLLAKEQYSRRQACVNLWVVPTTAITATAYEDADMFLHELDKSYRESWGYKTPRTVHVRDMGSPSGTGGVGRPGGTGGPSADDATTTQPTQAGAGEP